MKRFFYVYFLLLTFTSSQAIVKGSEAAVSIESHANFLQADNDNSMIGFGWFKNGFTLENSSTIVNFDSAYPIAGTIELNGGIVNLLQDLVFKNNTNLQSMGTIKANGYVVDFSPDILELPGPNATFENAKVFFNSDIIINSTVTFKGNCIVTGNGNTIYLGPQGKLLVDVDGVVAFRNVEIQGLNNQSLACVDDTGEIHFDNCSLLLTNDFTFPFGAFKFVDKVEFLGNHSFTYNSNIPSLIDVNSIVSFVEGVNFKAEKQGNSSRPSPFIFTDHSSILRFANAKFSINDSGLRLTRGTLMFDREVTIAITSPDYDSGIFIGDSTQEGDCYFQFNAGAILSLPAGHVTFDNFSTDVIKASAGNSAKLVRAEASYMQLLNNITFPNLGIALTSNAVPPIVIAQNKIIDYAESFISIPTGEFDVTSAQNSIFTYNLNGNDKIFCRRGILPLGLIVTGSENSIEGNGSITGPIILTGNTSSAIFGIDGLTQSSISLNGGTLQLSAPLQLARDAQLVGPGTVTMGSFNIVFPPSESDWSTPLLWTGVMGAIQLHSVINLQAPWTVQGEVIINGNNNKINLSGDGQIIVQPNSTLILKSVKITGISAQNITCVDSTATVILEDVEWYQLTDYHYERGALEVRGDVYMFGLGTIFNFETDKNLLINKNGNLRLEEGFTFNYDPQTNGTNHQILFQDASAALSLSGATIKAGDVGLVLDTGSIFVKRNSYLSSPELTDSESGAITIGTNNPAQDPRLIIYSSTYLKVVSGTLNIKTAQSSSFVFSNNGSELVISSDARLNIYSSLVLDPGLLTLQNHCSFGVSNSTGAQFTGSINIPGDYIYIDM